LNVTTALNKQKKKKKEKEQTRTDVKELKLDVQ